jgi:Protein of unknown function (DUF2516)
MDVVTLVGWVLSVVTLAVKVFALGDSVIRPAAAYDAVGRLPKPFWLIVLFLSAGAQVWYAAAFGIAQSWFPLLSVVGIVAALIYLFGMRPELIRYSPRKGRGRSSEGPYGPW